MEEKICPHCNNAIDHLNYEEEGYSDMTESYTASGSCNLEGDDQDEDDRNYGDTNYGNSEVDSIEYTCPECNHSVNVNDLIEINEENPRPKKKQQQLKRKITIPIPFTDLIHGTLNDINNNGEISFIICTKCKTTVEIMSSDDAGHREEEVECTHCGKTIKRNEVELITK